MRFVSPVLEHVTTQLARRVESLSPVPRSFREGLRMAGPMPGVGSDPVFLVPGLTADRWMYRRGKEMLEAEGYVVGGMQMPWHGWGGIPSDARQMRAGVERTIEHARSLGHDVDKVQVIGDSEGGLIARQFLQFEDGLDVVSRLVTNGTPHGGIRPLGSDRIADLGQRLLLPPGVKDLLTSSPVMHRLNADWPDFLARARALDPNFEAHAVQSRAFGMHHDGLVPEHAARLIGDAPVVRNYATDGAHSINLASGNRESEAGNVLLAILGSKDPMALAAASKAQAAADAFAGANALS